MGYTKIPWITDSVMRRLQSLRMMLTKTDRILTGSRALTVTMDFTASLPAPAASAGDKIILNAHKFADDIHSTRGLVSLLGANYHELCHVMFTPRSDTWYGTQARNTGGSIPAYRRMAFNILEDQRIETMFVALYPPAAKYFVSMIVKFFVGDQRGWDQDFLFTHGRRYLPLEIRQAFRDRFINTNDMAEAEAIIDEYRLMNFGLGDRSSVSTRALFLLDKFAAILDRTQAMTRHDIATDDCDGKSTENTTANSPTDFSKERHEAAEKAEEQTKEQDEREEQGEDGSDFWDDSSDEDDEAGEEDSDDEEGSGSGSDEDDDSDDGDGDDGDGDDEADDGDDSSGDESGEGDAPEGDGDGDSDDGDSEDGGEDSDAGDQDGETSRGNLEDILHETQDAVYESSSVQAEVSQIREAMNDPNAFDVESDMAPTVDHEVVPDAAIAVGKVTREFRRLYANFDPGWKYGSDSGRLNVGRAMFSDDLEDVFDEWDEGREHEAGMEVVIDVDLSGSMSGRKIQSAEEVTWVIKRALDDVDAVVSVIGFGTLTFGIYGRKEKASRSSIRRLRSTHGGTQPGQSFRISRRILSASSRPHKLFICITDGQFDNTNTEIASQIYTDAAGNSLPQGVNEDLGGILKEIPATRILVGYGYDVAAWQSCFDHTQTMNDIYDLVPLVQRTVTTMLDKGRRAGALNAKV